MTECASPGGTRTWPPDARALQALFGRQRLQRGRLLMKRIVELHQRAHGVSAHVVSEQGERFELTVQAAPDESGQTGYRMLCSCRTRRFCEHAAAVLLTLQEQADAPQREQDLQRWAQALRRRAPRGELQGLPSLGDADAARLLDLLLQPDEEVAVSADRTRPASADAVPASQAALTARFRPRLRLFSLGRGEGLLGMAPHGRFGPRGGTVSAAQVEWTYRLDDGTAWATPAPRSLLNSRPAATQLLADGRALRRDLAAEIEALDQLWASGLLPLDEAALQWRDPAAAQQVRELWTLRREDDFGTFWLEQREALLAQGWEVETRPGFVHRPAQVQTLRLEIQALALPRREGHWLASLGVEVDGELLDLAPMIAELLKRDARWLDSRQIAAIDDAAVIGLRAPGGRRIEVAASRLKPIVAAMVDLLQERNVASPLVLGDWDAARLDDLHDAAGWQCSGDAGLRRIAERLRAAGMPPPVEPPAGLGLELRPYQRAGLAWLQHLRVQGLAGILADDMGLGKTAQTLAHLLLEKQQGRLDRPALAVLPTSLLLNWAAEAQRIAPALRVLLLHGPARHRHFDSLADHDLVLTSYPLLWRDVARLERQPWHLLIADEAQTVKNAGSRAARALRRLEARHRLCLTGTPLENHLGELWALFDWLMPGFLGDARSFARRWRKPIEESASSLHAEALARRIRPVVMRRRKDEVARELPPLTVVTRRVALEGRQKELYESVRVAADHLVRRALVRQGFAGAQISVLDALLKLRQVCCDPLLVPGVEPVPGMERAKLELLAQMLPELLAEGRRVLVFSQFTRMLELVAEQLRALRLPFDSLTGATPAPARARLVQRFQDQQLPVLLVSLKAGGVGLNLTAADTVIQVDPWWNPAVMAQAQARAHRIGQDRPVFVYQLVVAGSIEERMLDLQSRKERLAEAMVGNDAADAAKFSPEDLELLLAPLETPDRRIS